MVTPWTMQICSVVGCRIYLPVFRLQEERKLLHRKEFRAGPNGVQHYDGNLGKARNKQRSRIRADVPAWVSGPSLKEDGEAGEAGGWRAP